MNTISFPGLGLEFTLPDGFDIGSFHIYFYGVIIGTGLLLAMIYAFLNFRKVGVDPDKAIDAIIGGVIGGIVGARLYYVVFKWEDFKDNLLHILDIRDGGLAIYGGLIGALAVGLLVAKWRKIHIPALLDIVGIGFLLGQGLGRWGNFFNVEAFGSNTSLPWGMTGPKVVSYLTAHESELAAIGVTVDPNMPVHPTFLYESLWCLLGFVLLALYLKHRKFDGEVFLMYLAYYGVERAIVEGLRTDSLMVGTVRVSQLLAILLVLASVILWCILRSRIRNSHDENYLKLYVLTEPGQRILQGIPEEPEPKKSRKKNKKKKSGESEEESDAAEETNLPAEEVESTEDAEPAQESGEGPSDAQAEEPEQAAGMDGDSPEEAAEETAEGQESAEEDKEHGGTDH